MGGIILLNKPQNRGRVAFFMSVDKVKFRKPVVPGDRLMIEVELVRLRAKTGQVRGRCLVDGQVVCEGDLMFGLAD